MMKICPRKLSAFTDLSSVHLSWVDGSIANKIECRETCGLAPDGQPAGTSSELNAQADRLGCPVEMQSKIGNSALSVSKINVIG